MPGPKSANLPALFCAAIIIVGVVGEFETRFPGAEGVVMLSAVGFNRDRTVAVVHVQYGSGCRFSRAMDPYRLSFSRAFPPLG